MNIYTQTTLISLFYQPIFIVQIILIVCGTFSRNKKYFKTFYESQLLVVPSILLLYPILINTVDKTNQSDTTMIQTIILTLLLFSVVSTIAAIGFDKKIAKENAKNPPIDKEPSVETKPSAYRYLFIILPIIYFFINSIPIVNIIKSIPQTIESYVENEEYDTQVLNYLNDKYGNHNFNLVREYSRSSKVNSGYYVDYIVMSNDIRFEIRYDVRKRKVSYERYLRTYIKRNQRCVNNTNLNTCMVEYIRNEKKELHLRKDLYKAYVYVDLDRDKIIDKYGEIPSMDVLKDEANIDFLCFELDIDRDNTDDEEYKNIILDMYRDYIEYYQEYDTYNKNNTIYYVTDIQENYIEIKDNKLIIHEDDKKLEVNIN